ncbi:putative uncharacterized protein DDB_G0277255 [Argonauta hians]
MERIVYECSSIVKSFNQTFSRNKHYQYTHNPKHIKQQQIPIKHCHQHQRDYHIYRPKYFVTSNKFLQFTRKLLFFLFLICTSTCLLLYAFVNANCNTFVTLSGGTVAVIETDRLNDAVIERDLQRHIGSQFKFSSLLNLSNVFPFKRKSGESLKDENSGLSKEQDVISVPFSVNAVKLKSKRSKGQVIRLQPSTTIPFRFAKHPGQVSGLPYPSNIPRKSTKRVASMAVKQNNRHGLRSSKYRNKDKIINSNRPNKFKRKYVNNKKSNYKQYAKSVRFIRNNRNNDYSGNRHILFSRNKGRNSDHYKKSERKTSRRYQDENTEVIHRYSTDNQMFSKELLSTKDNEQKNNNKDNIKFNKSNTKSSLHDYKDFNKELIYYDETHVDINNKIKSNKTNNSNNYRNISVYGNDVERSAIQAENIGERKGIYNNGRPLHIQRIRQNATKKLPQAIIIGVKKCGTRALLEYLRLHPDMKGTGPEPHFFDRFYNKGLEWYRKKMPATIDGQMTIEKTPSYFITKDVPRRIFNMSKEMKILVIVRDPVTRAISDYTQIASRRMNQMKPFEEMAFLNTSTRIVDTSRNIIRIGVYAKFLERWLHYFPLSQMHFVSGEQLISDPAQELSLVQDFLGLKRIISEKHFYFNETKGFPCVKKAEGSGHPHCLGKTKGRPHPTVDPMILKRLRDFYRPFNTKFYQMVNRNFHWP